jgi:protein-L-isoaspartate(D-aspartate) O-methyltransferase
MIKDQIVRRGVRDPRVLRAMKMVPRHEFVPAHAERRSYGDHPVPIGHDQTISQPYMVAVMSEYLGLKADSRVLEIGTGSGYQTAVLATLAAKVYTIERIPELSARARAKLTALGYENITYRVGDGSGGWPEAAPFDGIIVTAAAPAAPPTLIAELADPGVLVVPVGTRGTQNLVSVHLENGRERTEVHFRCSFVPLLGVEGFPD